MMAMATIMNFWKIFLWEQKICSYESLLLLLVPTGHIMTFPGSTVLAQGMLENIIHCQG